MRKRSQANHHGLISEKSEPSEEAPPAGGVLGEALLS